MSAREYCPNQPDCDTCLEIPGLGWYTCEACGKPFFAEDSDSDYVDVHTRQDSERLRKRVGDPPAEIPVAKKATANMSDDEFVERPALIFRAGHYPKKRVTVTVDNLRSIAAGTTEAPIQVGHVEERFKLGTVRNLIVKGQELWGTLRLHKPADALLALNDNLRTISAGILSDFSRLKEVSVTGSPHVGGAQMFTDTITADEDVFVFTLGEEQTNLMEDKDKPVVTVEQFSDLKAQSDRQAQLIEQLTRQNAEKEASIKTVKFALRKREAEAKVATFADRIPPVAQPKAIALLMTDETITFNDTEKPTAILFAEFLADLPVFLKPGIKGDVLFSEGGELTDEERSLGAKMGYSEADMKEIKAQAVKK